MPTPLTALIADTIRSRGPLTVAEYVDLALYHPECGYYSAAGRRSGREGDFFTSADLGPVFGELLAGQVAEMLTHAGGPPFDLVEAAAGSGRLARALLDHLERLAPECYAATRLHLVERSPAALANQAGVLGPHASRVATAGPRLPGKVRGVVLANELLDALPPHLVVMREDGLREVHVALAGDALVPVEREPSTPALEAYLERVGARLEPGWLAEVNLAAWTWVGEAARALDRGFLMLLDYGHEASLLYGAAHPYGTLTTFKRHAAEDHGSGPAWLREPGERDITSHVDLTGVRLAAEAAGLDHLGTVDQTYFLLGLVGAIESALAQPGAIDRRLALKTLLLPGGLGSTHKVLVFGRGVGRPALAGLRGKGRLT